MLKTEPGGTLCRVHQESLRPEKFPKRRISPDSDLRSQLLWLWQCRRHCASPDMGLGPGISPLGTTAHSRLEEAGQSIEAYSWPECIVLPTRHLCLGKAEWRPSEVVQVLIPRIWEYLTLYKGTRKICSIKDREMERRSWIMPVSTKICNHNAILIRGDRRIRERCKDGSRGRRRNTVLSALKMEEGAMSRGMQAASRS